MKRRFALLCIAAMVTAGACQGVQPSPAASTSSPTAPSPTTATNSTTEPMGSPSVFASAIYGYSIALPADWAILKPATSAWDGTGAPSHDGSATDLFSSSAGTLAWAYGAATPKTLDGFTSAQTAADAAAHPCPATPETDEAFMVAGDAARFTVKHCPVTGGILVAMTAVIHEGIGYVFYFQHPPTAPARDDDAAVFKALLAAVSLP